MVPEQAEGTDRVGPTTDVYALGVLLYELLTGRPPFKADTDIEVLRQVIHDEPVGPGRLRAGLPRDLESVCLKCLEKKPHRRYASAAALADDLRRFLSGQATCARPSSAWQRACRGLLRRPVLSAGLAGGLLALLALTGVAWYVSGVRDTAETASQERDRVQTEANAARQRLYPREMAMLDALAHEGRLTASQLAAVGPERCCGFEWRFLRRRVDTVESGTEWFVGRGHTHRLRCVAFSPDGQLCAMPAMTRRSSSGTWRRTSRAGGLPGTRSP